MHFVHKPSLAALRYAPYEKSCPKSHRPRVLRVALTFTWIPLAGKSYLNWRFRWGYPWLRDRLRSQLVFLCPPLFHSVKHHNLQPTPFYNSFLSLYRLSIHLFKHSHRNLPKTVNSLQRLCEDIIRCDTIQYSTVQCYAVQYSTISTVQFSAVQYNTIQ